MRTILDEGITIYSTCLASWVLHLCAIKINANLGNTLWQPFILVVLTPTVVPSVVLTSAILTIKFEDE